MSGNVPLLISIFFSEPDCNMVFLTCAEFLEIRKLVTNIEQNDAYLRQHLGISSPFIEKQIELVRMDNRRLIAKLKKITRPLSFVPVAARKILDQALELRA